MKSKEDIIQYRDDLENVWKQLLTEYNGFEKDSKNPLFRDLLIRMAECAASLETINWILNEEV